MSDYKNIIFDVGDVLVDFRHRAYMTELGFDEEMITFLTDHIIFTDFWEDLDRGARDVDDANDYFCELYPDRKNEITMFWENIEKIVAEFDYSKPLILEMKEKGYKVFLLSNYPDKLSDMHWPKFSFLPEVDGYLISAKAGIIKPDPAFYRMLMDRYRLKAEECVFIDDNPDNIEAAAKLGWHAIHFTGYEKLRETLKSDGIV